MEPMYIEEGPQQTYVKKGFLAQLSTPAIAGIVGVIAVVVVLGVVLGLIPVYINSSSSSSSSSSYSSSTLSTNTASCTGSSCSSATTSSGRTIVARGITATSSNVLTLSGGSTSATLDSAVQTYCMNDATYISLGLTTVTTYWAITAPTGSSTTYLFTQYTTLTFTAVLTSSNQNTGPTGTSPTNLIGEFLGTNSGSSKFKATNTQLTISSTVVAVTPTSASSITTSYTYGYISGGAITGNTCTGTAASPTSSCSVINNQPSGSITATPPPPTALINATAAASGGGRFGPGANAPKLVDSDFVLFELN